MLGRMGGFILLVCLGGPQFAQANCPPANRTLARPFDVAYERHVAYCERGGETLRLDYARPAAGQRVPLILFIHGGAWVEGSRDYYSWEIDEAARRGFGAATLDYRVGRPFPAALADIRCAVRWFRANASSLGIDPWRIGVAGGSAGGHLALLAGVTPDSLFSESGDPRQDLSAAVQGVVNFFGPTDLAALTRSNPNLASTIDSVFPNLGAASPVEYVTGSSPPILTIHGTNDDTVSYNQAQILEERARNVGARHELVTCWGEGHGFSPSDRTTANDHLFDFFARIFGLARNVLHH